ncbi:MAG TPA: ABC transporter ATP-binding protein [Streptosporangiaceae bacterium]|nr:ABC transporter ATP-binding protein [Streptosporangiaceae bacterium]
MTRTQAEPGEAPASETGAPAPAASAGAQWPAYRAALGQLLAALGLCQHAPASLPQAPDRVAAAARAAGARACGGRLSERDLTRRWLALLAADATDGSPVALLPGRTARRDPAQGTPGHQRRLASHGWRLYPRLPGGDAAAGTLLRLALRGVPRWQPMLAAVAWTAVGLSAALVPIGAGYLASAASGHRRGLPALTVLGLAAAGVVLALGVGDRAATALLNRAQSRVEPAIWDRLLSPPLPASRRYRCPQTLADAGSAVPRLRSLVSPAADDAILAVVLTCSALVILMAVSALLGTFVLTALMLLALAVGWLTRAWRRGDRRAEQQGTGISSLLNGALTAIVEVQAYRREQLIVARCATAVEFQQRARAAGQRLDSYLAALAAAFPAALFALLLLAAWQGAITTDRLLVAGFAVVQVVLALGRADRTARSVLVVGGNIISGLRESLCALPEQPVMPRSPGVLSGAVELAGVSFRYPDTPGAVLVGVTLRIEPGELVVVAGGAGAGKSTLLRLLAGLDRPQCGEVRCDGGDLAEVDLDLVRAQIGFVPQDIRLPRGTMRSVITGSWDADLDARAWAAAEAVGIAGHIRQLPMRLESGVSDSDAGLSAGQVQQLALARALAKRPRILLLDDATSDLDAATAALVHQQVLAAAMTRVVVTRCPELLRAADRIVVLAAGRVAGCGSYQSLTGGGAGAGARVTSMIGEEER